MENVKTTGNHSMAYVVMGFVLAIPSLVLAVGTGMWVYSAAAVGLLFGYLLQKGDLCFEGTNRDGVLRRRDCGGRRGLREGMRGREHYVGVGADECGDGGLRNRDRPGQLGDLLDLPDGRPGTHKVRRPVNASPADLTASATSTWNHSSSERLQPGRTGHANRLVP